MVVGTKYFNEHCKWKTKTILRLELLIFFREFEKLVAFHHSDCIGFEFMVYVGRSRPLMLRKSFERFLAEKAYCSNVCLGRVRTSVPTLGTSEE